MTTEQFECERDYQLSLVVTKYLLQQGLISNIEFKNINYLLMNHFHPILGGLLF